MIIMRCSFPRLLTKFVANYKSKVALVGNYPFLSWREFKLLMIIIIKNNTVGLRVCLTEIGKDKFFVSAG